MPRWQVEQVRQIVTEALEELIQPYIYAEAAQLIAQHRSAGRDVVLVSASGEEMVGPIGEMLGVDRVIATRMKVVDGRYTGEIDFYAAGPAKAEAVRALAAEQGYDLAESYAYSDSVTDVPLLSTVGHPTAVNPDRGLRKVAAERQWPTLEFRHPVPLGVRLRERPAVPAAAAAIGVGRARHRHRRYGRRRRNRNAARLAASLERRRGSSGPQTTGSVHGSRAPRGESATLAELHRIREGPGGN